MKSPDQSGFDGPLDDDNILEVREAVDNDYVRRDLISLFERCERSGVGNRVGHGHGVHKTRNCVVVHLGKAVSQVHGHDFPVKMKPAGHLGGLRGAANRNKSDQRQNTASGRQGDAKPMNQPF